jgi:hypothetical protein
MARLVENPKRLTAACCRVEVMNGADARDVVRLVSILATLNFAFETASKIR